MKKIQALLDSELLKRNSVNELSYERPDPLLVAARYRDEYIAMACALFGYGRARHIVTFLESIDFSILDSDERNITNYFSSHYYRFQSVEDVRAFFIMLYRLKHSKLHVEDIIYSSYAKNSSVIEGINHLIETLYTLYDYDSKGYRFLLSTPITKTKGSSALKRWMMYMRWMVRKDNLDMGLFNKIERADLIVPLDTHTHNVSLKLGLIKRKSYDMQAALELTKRLKMFDANDPTKYDFALYRLGQEKIDLYLAMS